MKNPPNELSSQMASSSSIEETLWYNHAIAAQWEKYQISQLLQKAGIELEPEDETNPASKTVQLLVASQQALSKSVDAAATPEAFALREPLELAFNQYRQRIFRQIQQIVTNFSNYRYNLAEAGVDIPPIVTTAAEAKFDEIRQIATTHLGMTEIHELSMPKIREIVTGFAEINNTIRSLNLPDVKTECKNLPFFPSTLCDLANDLLRKRKANGLLLENYVNQIAEYVLEACLRKYVLHAMNIIGDHTFTEIRAALNGNLEETDYVDTYKQIFDSVFGRMRSLNENPEWHLVDYEPLFVGLNSADLLPTLKVRVDALRAQYANEPADWQTRLLSLIQEIVASYLSTAEIKKKLDKAEDQLERLNFNDNVPINDINIIQDNIIQAYKETQTAGEDRINIDTKELQRKANKIHSELISTLREQMEQAITRRERDKVKLLYDMILDIMWDSEDKGPIHKSYKEFIEKERNTFAEILKGLADIYLKISPDPVKLLDEVKILYLDAKERVDHMKKNPDASIADLKDIISNIKSKEKRAAEVFVELRNYPIHSDLIDKTMNEIMENFEDFISYLTARIYNTYVKPMSDAANLMNRLDANIDSLVTQINLGFDIKKLEQIGKYIKIVLRIYNILRVPVPLPDDLEEDIKNMATREIDEDRERGLRAYRHIIERLGQIQLPGRAPAPLPSLPAAPLVHSESFLTVPATPPTATPAATPTLFPYNKLVPWNLKLDKIAVDLINFFQPLIGVPREIPGQEIYNYVQEHIATAPELLKPLIRFVDGSSIRQRQINNILVDLLTALTKLIVVDREGETTSKAVSSFATGFHGKPISEKHFDAVRNLRESIKYLKRVSEPVRGGTRRRNKREKHTRKNKCRHSN